MHSQTSSKPAEHPTDGQMIQLFTAIDKKLATKANLQNYLDFIYLESTGKSPEPIQKPKINKVMSQALWAARKYFPDAALNIVAMLKPYTELTQLNFTDPNLYATGVYDDFDDLQRALFWADVKDVKLHYIGKGWKPLQEIADRDRMKAFSVFRRSMCADAMKTRKELDSMCEDNARGAVLLHMESLLTDLFNKNGAYQYQLISQNDWLQIRYSITYALTVAVVLTAIQYDPAKVKQVLRFVDFQLSGTPVIDYQDGVVHLLCAPKHPILGRVNIA